MNYRDVRNFRLFACRSVNLRYDVRIHTDMQTYSHSFRFAHLLGHSSTQESRKSRIRNFKWSHHGLDGCADGVDTEKL